MSTEIKFKDLTFAEDSPYKTQTVSIGSKSLATPAKAIDTRKLIARIPIDPKIRGINEVYKVFNSESVKEILSTGKEQEVNNAIQWLLKRDGSENDFNICFVEFDEDRFPNENEIEYLTNLSYVHSDITPVPLLPRISKRITPQNLESFTKFTKSAIDAIEVSNNKPILGVIPMPLPSIFIPRLLDTYVDNGITSFCLDFQGLTVGSSLTKIRSLLKTLLKEKLSEQSMVYTLNLGAGKLPKAKDVVPAKDILSFGYGFDILGGQHVRKKLTQEVRAKILRSRNLFKNSLRLFNKEDYGYHRATKKEEVKKVYPSDSKIPLELLERLTSRKKLDKLFNQEQQGLEAVRLRTIIREEGRIIKYLDKKQFVEKKDIKTLTNIKKSGEQTTLA